MSTRPLEILVVADDRKLLRHLSRFLHDFGYRVRQAADAAGCLAAVSAAPPDLVLVDEKLAVADAASLVRQLTKKTPDRDLVVMLLVSEPSHDALLEALEAGVDDFLAKPIVYGELLARLRAAARTLEYERRMRRQCGRDPLTGAANREALLARLYQELHQGGAKTGSLACVAIDLDFFGRINLEFGRSLGDDVLRRVAEALEHERSPDEIVAHLGNGRFALLLPGRSELDAAAWAESMRARLAALAIPCGDPGAPAIAITASLGVYACHRGIRTAEEILDHAEQALAAAKRSGRNCVARFGEFATEQQVWDELAAPGKLFERTVARDVMTPSTCTLQNTESVQHAAYVFRRSRLPIVPVVDQAGALVGTVTEDQSLMEAAEDNSDRPVEELMVGTLPRVAEDASLASILEFFGRDPSSVAVVVGGRGQPAGYITRDSLTALIRPVTEDRFAAAGPYDPSGEYLLVPDVSYAEELYLTR
jgi:two-component system cell cycle response regulator